MAQLERPLPAGQNARGITIYDGRRVAAYRLARGVKVEEVAQAIRISPSLVSHYMTGRSELQEKWALKILAAIDRLGNERDEMRREGMARLAGDVEVDAKHRTIPAPTPTAARMRQSRSKTAAAS